MTIQRKPKYIAAHMLQRLAKRQPRTPKPKNPGMTATRKLVAERSGGWCEICGVMRAESIHHRRNQSQGGPWTASNCVHACGDGTRKCHGWVTMHPKDAAAEGWHLEAGDDPLKVPIISGLHGVVRLADDGSITPVGGAA
ncbi:HNH endonuclease [Nocardia sp. CC227C]|uniref:HNH endonuclease n=1 Tax=Nocardia sp. CC227C TaxID=3044562 RepID=UPI00278C0C92|nr:HNH endonuclease signature motif containing protein [Nocardia sp. CC227C]